MTEEKFSNVDLSEAVILGLCPDASNPNFRQIQKIVMTSAQDTGLIWVFLDYLSASFAEEEKVYLLN